MMLAGRATRYGKHTGKADSIYHHPKSPLPPPEDAKKRIYMFYFFPAPSAILVRSMFFYFLCDIEKYKVL